MFVLSPGSALRLRPSRDRPYVPDHGKAIDLGLRKGKIGETYRVGGTHREITHFNTFAWAGSILLAFQFYGIDPAWIMRIAYFMMSQEQFFTEQALGRGAEGEAMDEKGKPEVVVITGASAGVGRATAQAFARRGAHIGLLARGRDGLEGTRREVEQLGGKALVLPTDVADAEQVETAAARVEEELGPIDIWVNNAMVSVFSPVKEMTAEEYRRVTEVTYLGFVYGTLAALKRMLPRDRGSIVQVGSALAYRGIPLQSAYCASKHAIQGFCDSLRAELIHDGSHVRLTMVQMPALNTPQFDWVRSRLPNKAQPVPPIFQPEVAADAIVWAAHHDRREIFVGQSTVMAILGNRLAPWFGDWYLSRTGYEGQQTDEPRDPDSPDNLWEPLPGDRGAHGRFDEQAQDSSWQLWATTHRSWVALAGAGVASAAIAALLGRNR